MKLKIIRDSGAEIQLGKELRISEMESLESVERFDKGRRGVLIDIVKSSGSVSEAPYRKQGR